MEVAQSLSTVEKPHRDRREYKRAWLKSPSRPRARCHTEKPHRARGLCDACYDRWLYANSPRHRSNRLRTGSNWKKSHPREAKELDRENKLRMKYRITMQDYDSMFSHQAGKCAICGRADLILSVDHDHNTGVIRGLLCLPCNSALAWLERLGSNSEWVAKAQGYLGVQNIHA